MALNLAVSIKCNDPFTEIALIYTDSAVPPLNQSRWSNRAFRKWFDYLIKCPEHLLSCRNQPNGYLWPRLYVYELSPFKRTFYLDADSIVLRGRRINALLDSLRGREYAWQYSKSYPVDSDGGWWVKCADLLEAYGRCAETVYEINGFVSYFDRSAANAEFFALAREIAGNPRLLCRSFRGDVGDETAQITAAFILDRRPTGDAFSPVLWQGLLAQGARPSDPTYLAYTFTHSDPPQMCREYVDLVKEYAAPRSLKLHAELLAEPKPESFGDWIRFEHTPVPTAPRIDQVGIAPAARTFPRLVHQIWINREGDNQIPRRYVSMINSWFTTSDLEHRMYSHADLREFLATHYPDFLAFYDNATYETEQSDICRYLLLHRFGGIYADADLRCLRSLDPLLARIRLPVAMALEPPAHRFWGRRLLGSAFVLSQPGQDLWLELVTFMREHYRPNSYPGLTTGPMLVDWFLNDRGYKLDVEVLDSQYIFPIDLNRRVQIENSEPFCEHVWTGVDSWVAKVPYRLRRALHDEPFDSIDALRDRVDDLLNGDEISDRPEPASP